MAAVFIAPSSDALRSDRSAGDRQRHREKLREAIRDNIADIISEESIIGRDRTGSSRSRSAASRNTASSTATTSRRPALVRAAPNPGR